MPILIIQGVIGLGALALFGNVLKQGAGAGKWLVAGFGVYIGAKVLKVIK